jgi:hypothetical protein
MNIRGNDFMHTESTPKLSQRSNFDSFYMDIQTHAEPTRKRFHRLLSIRGKVSLLAEHEGKYFSTNFAGPAESQETKKQRMANRGAMDRNTGIESQERGNRDR